MISDVKRRLQRLEAKSQTRPLADITLKDGTLLVLTDLEILDMLQNSNVRALRVEWRRGAVVYPYMELLAGLLTGEM